MFKKGNHASSKDKVAAESTLRKRVMSGHVSVAPEVVKKQRAKRIKEQDDKPEDQGGVAGIALNVRTGKLKQPLIVA